MKNTLYIILINICFIQVACEDFVEVDVPDNKIVSETVFGSDETANSALVGIYNELFKSDFSNGGFRSITLLGGLAADNLRTTSLDQEMTEFEENEILVDNSYNLAIWSSAYNIIYMCNNAIEGLNTYDGVSADLKDQLMGEALFVRSFVYFYLVNLYGEVPFIQSPDYRKNVLATRTGTEDIYHTIIADLEFAASHLGNTYLDGERIRPNKFTAMALLARTYLYLENWVQAEKWSSQVINSVQNFEILDNLDDVFLANSKEAIWQISPAGSAMASTTNEGRIFILTIPPPDSQRPVALTEDLLDCFSKVDNRLTNWIGKLDSDSEIYYYPFKYKSNSSDEITEYSMVMRLGEQYLIRAEARAHQGKLKEAINDIDQIRNRAHIDLISSSSPGIDVSALLDSIQVERRRELFTEWGHRWLDLKRTKTASEELGIIKPSWQNTDELFPIPESELNKDHNLTQNTGY